MSIATARLIFSKKHEASAAWINSSRITIIGGVIVIRFYPDDGRWQLKWTHTDRPELARTARFSKLWSQRAFRVAEGKRQELHPSVHAIIGELINDGWRPAYNLWMVDGELVQLCQAPVEPEAAKEPDTPDPQTVAAFIEI